MQEELENRTLTLMISATRFTGRTLQAAISKYMAHQREVKLRNSSSTKVVHHGRKTVKQLTAHNQGLSSIDLTDSSTKEFERMARKYGVDYAVRKLENSEPQKYLIFFKANDAGAINAAFEEYCQRRLMKGDRPSMRERLAKLLSAEKKPIDRIRNKVPER